MAAGHFSLLLCNIIILIMEAYKIINTVFLIAT